MESAVWGWILLGIAIGYLLNNRCCEKSIKNSGEQNSFTRPSVGPLTIPVTLKKLEKITPISEDSLLLIDLPFQVQKGYSYKTSFYDTGNYQHNVLITTKFESPTTNIYMDDSALVISPDVTPNIYKCCIIYKDQSFQCCESTFSIVVS